MRMSIDNVIRTALHIKQIDASPQEVINMICREAGITRQELLGDKRSQPLALWRQAGYYILREHCGLSYPRIGQLMGGKHHTTVMHGVDKFERYCEAYSSSD